MGMLELVLTVCAVAQPATRRDQRVLIDSDTTPWECAMSAPPFIAKWGSEHPDLQIQCWTFNILKKEKDI